MKKFIFIITAILFVTTLTSCGEKTSLEDIYPKVMEKLSLPDDTVTDLNIPESIEIDGKTYQIKLEASGSLSNKGSITQFEEDQTVPYKLYISLDGEEYYQERTLLIHGFKKVESAIMEALQIPSETKENLILKSEVNLYNTTYDIAYSVDSEYLDEYGFITRGYDDQVATLNIEITNGRTAYSKTLEIKILGIKSEIDPLINALSLPSKTDVNLTFPEEIEVDGKTYSVLYTSESLYINSRGVIYRSEEDKEEKISVIFTNEDELYETEINITIIGYHREEEMNLLLETYEMPEEVDDDIALPDMLGNYKITWSSNNSDVLSSSGKYNYVLTDTVVTLTAEMKYNLITVKKSYNVTVKTITDEERVKRVIENYNLSGSFYNNIILPTSFDFGVTGSWVSLDQTKVTNAGVVLTKENTTCKLTLTLTANLISESKTFEIEILSKGDNIMLDHMLVDRAKNFIPDGMTNTVLDNDKLVLKNGETEGYYLSPVFETKGFDELVGSWAAITSTTATCELEIKLRVGDTWSKYFSYQKWGLGLQNKSVDSSDSLAKMSTDEILLKSGVANAYQYKITLRRNAATNDSPKVSLVAITINIPNYTYEVDSSSFPSFVDYDVPKLNQNMVPVIGGSICSITSSTMLLKYKGHDFTSYDSEYEHRYIAGLFKDYGADIYGNWVFNTVGMSSYGEDSYFKRMYSWEELQEHLIKVGPVAASIKGNTGVYTTNGHLIVVRGYRVVNGSTYVICNDPNINSRFGNDKDGNPLFVYYEFPLDTFMGFWRNVVYVIE